ncbi:hypothetical protein NDU88_003828 [Pleurodeles waltl]|uniref:Uncharacterized protein n=1 Tax=Pleurodeles waltl TaxID=8319 RepID=A0AAV7QD56_PLEWA|nr:hypothetical protein NDU88_003828 [Pleurodeles waltl]
MSASLIPVPVTSRASSYCSLWVGLQVPSLYALQTLATSFCIHRSQEFIGQLQVPSSPWARAGPPRANRTANKWPNLLSPVQTPPTWSRSAYVYWCAVSRPGPPPRISPAGKWLPQRPASHLPRTGTSGARFTTLCCSGTLPGNFRVAPEYRMGAAHLVAHSAQPHRDASAYR